MNQTSASSASPLRIPAIGAADPNDIPAVKHRTLVLLLLAAVLLGIGLRLRQYALKNAYWHDEASLVVNIFEKTALELLGPLESAQAAAPGFLLAQRAMHVMLGRSELAMRLLPLLAAIAGMLLFARLAWRTVPPAAALLLVLLFACSERLIWHAAEAKQYSVDVLVAVVLLWVALDERRSATRRLVSCAAIATLAIWFSHATAFLFGGASLALLPAVWREHANRPARAAATWIACNAAFAVSFLALYLVSIRDQQVSVLYSYWAEGFVDFTRPWFIPVWFAHQLLDIVNYGLDLGGPVLLPLALIGGYVLYVTARRQALSILLFPVGLVLIAAALRQYPFGGSRLTLFLTPAAFLLAGVGAEAVAHWARNRAAWGWLPVGLTAYLVGVAAFHGGTYLFRPPKRGNMAPAAHYIAAHDQPGDRIYANKVSEFRCYWPEAEVRDAEELNDSIPTGRFWLAVSAIPGKKDRRTEDLLRNVQAEAHELAAFTIPGSAALLFENNSSDAARTPAD